MMQPGNGVVPQQMPPTSYNQQPPPPQQWMMPPPPPQQQAFQPQPPPQYWTQQAAVPPPQQAQPQQQQYSSEQTTGGSDEIKSLWIGDLQYWMDETYIINCFAQTGELSSVKVIRNKQTGQPEGYGFIEFVSRAAAERMLQTYNGSLMPNSEQNFRLNWATLGAGERRADDGPDYTIFVGDLAADVTDYLLLETFKPHYSSLKGAKVVTDRLTGRAKGYGFVRFGDESEQLRAMTEMNGVLCSTRPMRIGPAATKKPAGTQQYQKGIMLKKARMTKKGKCDSNVANWDLIETLVVQSNDLVQVIAKGISLPADGVISNVAGDDARDIASAILSLECAAGGVKIKKSNKINRDKMQTCQTRQVGDDRSQVKQFDYKGSADFQMEGTTHEVQSSGSSLDTCYTQSKAVKEMHQDRSSKMLPNGALSGPPASSVVKPNDKCQDSPHPNDASLRAPISGTSIVEGSEKARVNSSSTRTEIVPLRSSSSTSKLNPGAKVFCPSFANHRSVTPPAVPTAANVAYVPDFPVVPIISAQQEAEISQFVPRSSLPVKLVPYGNLMAGNGIIDSQYSQSI